MTEWRHCNVCGQEHMGDGPTPCEPARQAACAPPTHHAFDIDIYDCPCGHMYGDHDYTWLRTAVHPEKAMVIIRCETCGSVPHG